MSISDIFTSSIFEESEAIASIGDFIICMIASLILGILVAYIYTYKTKHTKSFVVTLAVLPAIVCVVIMMVNGNVGTGVAVAGTFSLVRFRSVPGTAKEIGAIFLSMAVGLATSMGYIGFAALAVILVSIVSLVLTGSSFGNNSETERTLVITIPEDLDYTGIFDDLFEKYTKKYELNRVKTSNMGSLFKVTYDIDLVSQGVEKDFIDDIRCRNGNLEIVMAKHASTSSEL